MTFDEALSKIDKVTVLLPLTLYAMRDFDGTIEDLEDELTEKDLADVIVDLTKHIQLSRGWQDIESEMVEKLDVKETEKPAKKKRSVK